MSGKARLTAFHPQLGVRQVDFNIVPAEPEIV
jgi:hypothetical protein